MIEWDIVKTELNNWRDIIGDDIVDTIITNLEDEVLEEDHCSNCQEFDCDGCEYSKPYIEYKCTHHSCKFEDKPQTEREGE